MRLKCDLTLLEKVRSADIRESLNIESLLLRLERSQLCCYGHMTRISQDRTAKQLLYSTPIGQSPLGWTIPDPVRGITLKILVGLALESHQSIDNLWQKIKMLGRSNSSCCPCVPLKDKRVSEK